MIVIGILILLLMCTLMIARWIIAIQLTRVSRRNKLPNLLWLAAFFYITGVGDVFLMLSFIPNLIGTWPFFLSVGLGEVVLVMFIQKTFYQDRKSPFLVFMLIALAFLVANLFFPAAYPYWSPFNWLWLIWVGYQAYKRIAADPLVEDWVKTRYKLVIAYSLVALAAPAGTILVIIGMLVPALDVVSSTTIATALGGLVAAFTTLGIVLEYLAWVMPERYRRFLNRKYQPPVQAQDDAAELSEEEIMRKLKPRS